MQHLNPLQVLRGNSCNCHECGGLDCANALSLRAAASPCGCKAAGLPQAVLEAVAVLSQPALAARRREAAELLETLLLDVCASESANGPDDAGADAAALAALAALALCGHHAVLCAQIRIAAASVRRRGSEGGVGAQEHLARILQRCCKALPSPANFLSSGAAAALEALPASELSDLLAACVPGARANNGIPDNSANCGPAASLQALATDVLASTFSIASAVQTARQGAAESPDSATTGALVWTDCALDEGNDMAALGLARAMMRPELMCCSAAASRAASSFLMQSIRTVQLCVACPECARSASSTPGRTCKRACLQGITRHCGVIMAEALHALAAGMLAAGAGPARPADTAELSRACQMGLRVARAFAHGCLGPERLSALPEVAPLLQACCALVDSIAVLGGVPPALRLEVEAVERALEQQRALMHGVWLQGAELVFGPCVNRFDRPSSDAAGALSEYSRDGELLHGEKRRRVELLRADLDDPMRSAACHGSLGLASWWCAESLGASVLEEGMDACILRGVAGRAASVQRPASDRRQQGTAQSVATADGR